MIHTLVTKFLPEFPIRHKRQMTGMEGPDLAEARRHQILATARNIPPESIHQVTGTNFLVASQSHPGHHYPIDITESICDCADFPRIRYCKHIAAIHVHFPQICTKRSSPSKTPESVRTRDPPQRTPRPEEESADILEDINTLYQQFNAVSDHTDLQALKSVRYSLRTAIASANGSRALPEMDDFPANQNTWVPTTKSMGATKAPKRKLSPVAVNAEQHIGAVQGKRAGKHSDDPYAGGERSGKRAKPDAVSAAANERARVAVPAVGHSPRPAVLAPARASPSAVAAGFAARSLARANLSVAVPLAYFPLSAAPGHAFSPLSAVPPGSAFAPVSATGLGFAHAERSTENTRGHK